MAPLVLATAYFTVVYLDLRSKLEIVAGHALSTAERIFGIPSFLYYARADVIKDILGRSHHSPHLKVARTQP